MRTIKTGDTFECTANNFASGLEGTIGVRLLDTPQGAELIARTTAGILERPPGSGLYAVQLVAPPDAGFYSIVWDDGAAPTAHYAREDVQATTTGDAPGDVSWRPTADDLATILRARTKDNTGRELGAWTVATRPTLDEVERIIDLAARDKVGSDGFSGPCTRSARAAITYHAACLIELSYFPEQVRSARSPYDELKTQADEATAALDECMSSGVGPDGGSGGEGYGYHSLPVRPATLVAHYGEGWRHPEYPATWQRPCVPASSVEPAQVSEPEPPREPLPNVVIGHPSEGDPARGLPPINTGSLPGGLT